MPLPMFNNKNSGSSKKINHVIAIAAGKGGVGKSTVTVMLARALRLMGFAVGVLDADIYGPSIRKMLPEDEMPAHQDGKLTPARCGGIKMISMAHFRKEADASAVRAPIANQIITQFLKEVDWGDLDYLLIDFPPGTGDIQLTLAQKASLTGAVMVTTPQEVAIMDVKKAIDLFRQVNVPIIGIIENMSGYFDSKSEEPIYLFGKGGGERLARESSSSFLGSLPIDPELSLRTDQGISIFSGRRSGICASAEPFFEIAKKIHETIESLVDNNQNQPQIKHFYQKNVATLTVEWQDGKTQDYNLCDLQQNCPCAKCVDEVTGKRLVDASKIDPDVGANKIMLVGRYGLSIQFTSGCSHGIYPLNLLR